MKSLNHNQHFNNALNLIKNVSYLKKLSGLPFLIHVGLFLPLRRSLFIFTYLNCIYKVERETNKKNPLRIQRLILTFLDFWILIVNYSLNPTNQKLLFKILIFSKKNLTIISLYNIKYKIR